MELAVTVARAVNRGLNARVRALLTPSLLPSEGIPTGVAESARHDAASGLMSRVFQGRATMHQMRVAIELTEAQADELRARAKRLGLAPEELASAAVAELLSEPEPDFEQAARNVLSKNAELYRRLAR
jgi:antitoxin FitA